MQKVPQEGLVLSIPKGLDKRPETFGTIVVSVAVAYFCSQDLRGTGEKDGRETRLVCELSALCVTRPTLVDYP